MPMHAHTDCLLHIQTVGCGQQVVTDLASDFAAALAVSSPQVVVVCPMVDSSLSNTQAGLEQELDQLLVIQEVVDASEVKHVSVYLSQGKQAVNRRRSLQQTASPPPAESGRVVLEPLTGFGPYTTCGTLCQVLATYCYVMLLSEIIRRHF